MRSFSSFNTHTYNNIVCELDLLNEVTKLKSPYINSLVDNYVIQTGLNTEG